MESMKGIDWKSERLKEKMEQTEKLLNETNTITPEQKIEVGKILNSESAKPIWEKYRAALNPKITRLAVRYVNRFDIPITDRNYFYDYFRTVPKIAPEIDTGLAGYLMQLVLPQPDLDAMLILNQTQVPPVQPETTALVLDIDLYRELKIPQDEEAIWDVFSNLRHRKNKIFEMCITDETRELIR